MCTLSLATDFNGPLVNMTEATRRALEKVTGLVLLPDYFTGKDIIEKETLFMPQGGGKPRKITLSDWHNAKAEIYDGTDEAFCSYALPNPGVDKALADIWGLDCSITVVSRCRGVTPKRFRQWAGRYGIPISDAIVNVDSKGQFYGNVLVAVDDHLEHLRQFQTGVVTPILMAESPPEDLPDRILCVPDWSHVVDHLLTMELR